MVQPLFNVFVFATGRNKRQLTKVRASQTIVLTNGGAVNWAVVFSPFRTLSSRCCYIGLLLIALAFSSKLYIASEVRHPWLLPLARFSLSVRDLC